jgi:hypothetical protein
MAGADDFVINGGSTTSPAGMSIRSDYQASNGNGQWYISFDNKQGNAKGGLFYSDAEEIAQLIVRGAGRFKFQCNKGIWPHEDNNDSLGKSSHRWKDVWAIDTSINSSDERRKENIQDSDLGLSFINQLRPVSYKWKNYTDQIPLESNGEVVEGEFRTKERTFTRRHYGFIGQEIETLLADNGIDTNDFAGYIYDEESDRYSLRLGEFIAPMMKAIQELSAKNEELSAKVEALENA